MAENQEQVKPNEREIPVFTVLKNNCILKNIFLLDNPPSISSSSLSVVENGDKESEIEEILVVGRHPDCNIKLEHPSISRFHLRIHSKPSSRSLSVTDLSSVHGTWISGKRIEPRVTMKLNEGDTLRLGASSRLYRLQWVPISQAYDIDNPFVPPLDADPADEGEEEETEGAIDQDENSLSCSNDQVQSMSDNTKGLEMLFSDEDRHTITEKMIPMAPLMTEGLCNSFCNEEEVDKDSSLGTYNQENVNMIPMAPVMTEGLCNSFCNKEEVDKAGSVGTYNQENELSSPKPFHLENESSTPRARFPSELAKSVSQLETTEISGLNSQKRSGLSIWSRRGKNESVKIETSRSRGSCGRIDMIPLFDENHTSELVMEDHYSSPDDNEQIFSMVKENMYNKQIFNLDKENMYNEQIFNPDKKNKYNKQTVSPDKQNTHNEHIFMMDRENTYNKQIFSPDKENTFPASLRSLKSKVEQASKSELISKALISCVDQDEEEIFTPDKENMTPSGHLLRPVKIIEKYRSSPLKGANYSNMYQEEALLHTLDNLEVRQERKSTNSAIKSHVSLKKDVAVLNSRANRDPFCPLLLNLTSNDSYMYQEEGDFHTSDNHEVLQEQKSTTSAFKSHVSLKKEAAVLNAEATREPFRPLPLNLTSNIKANSKPSVREDTMVDYSSNNTMKVDQNWWIIVADTGCLLNKNSRKELQLLRGLRGTSLIIPRIVVRELDCMKRRGSFFTRTTEVSAALQWIQESMAVAKWWIHVQTSAEEGRLIPPTPPASPHWFSDEKCLFSVGSKPFSPHNLQEIVTPTTADHILECALLFKRTKNEGQLVLLSDDVALKIKAMAEGVVCETAEEFRRSLVNPFSLRFLYSDSSPIGPTWSCVDDTVLKEKYYPSPLKKLSKSGEGVKGLKLILLHNSNFRQIKPVR